VKPILEILAGIPTVVLGLFGLYVINPEFVEKYWPIGDPIAYSAIGAGFMTGILIVPIIASVADDALSAVPRAMREAAYALGATRWAMIKAVVIPYGRSGVVGGAMLGLGRAMGETVAVYTVLNLVYQINWQVLIGAGGNVASMILLKFGEAGPTETRALMAAGLALFILTLIVKSIANVIVTKTGGKGR
jgi:phosphate transport system permease protein